MSNPKEANFRIVRYNGEYMIEVLDKPIGHWYVVASHVKTRQEAVKLCEKYEEKPTKPILTAEDIKRIVDIADNMFELFSTEELENMGKEQYYEEILKRYNDGN